MNELSVPVLSASATAGATLSWAHRDMARDGVIHKAARLECESGFSLVRSDITTTQNYAEPCAHEGHERQLVIAFGLHGHSGFQDRKGHQLAFAANQTTVSIFREGCGSRLYAADQQIRQLRLIVSESALIRFIGPERSARLFGSALGMHESFRQIASGRAAESTHLRFFKRPGVCQQDGLTQRIHALSLLSEQLQMLEPAEHRPAPMRASDLDKLEEIEAHIRANVHQPLSNAYLCAKFAISEYRLKEMFRQAYGASPAQHLLELRMLRAREMLAAGMRVSETAYRLGYQHPNNLSAAFVRFFGCTPKSVRSGQR